MSGDDAAISRGMSRRELLCLTLGTGAVALTGMVKASVLRRPIPGGRELLPVIGLGTWQTFDGDD